MKKWFLIFAIVGISLFLPKVNAEPILISISDEMDHVVFDGKWTNPLEWKKSSLNTFEFQDNQIYFRSAHQEDFIYFMIDVVPDITSNPKSDKAMICLDNQSNLNSTFNENIYCFFATLDEKSKIMKGSLQTSEPFEEIFFMDFIGLSSISDENDRYSTTPHLGYEFKIPTKLVGRSSEYGIFIAVFDGGTNRIFSWPENNNSQSLFENPRPSHWGEMISPDKSLPEFGWPIMILVPTFLIIILLGRLQIKF